MKNQICCIIFFLLSTVIGFGQTKKIDSLKQILQNDKLNYTTKISVTINLSKAFQFYSPDSVKHYAKKAIKLSKSSNNYLLGRAYNYLSVYYLETGQIDSSKYFSKRVIKLGEIEKDTTLLIWAYNNYASAVLMNNEFNESIQLYLKAIKLAKSNKKKLSHLQYNLALNYANATYDSLAIKYLKLSTENARRVNFDEILSYTLPNLAYFAMEDNQLDSAKTYLDENLIVCERLASARSWSTYYLSLGVYYQKVKILDKSGIAFNKALYESKRVDYKYNIIGSYTYLAKHFVLMNDPINAIKNLKAFEKLYETYPIQDFGLLAYEQWAKAEKMLDNHKNANEFLEKHIQIKDSLNSEKNKTSIANAEAKYQTEKKDKEIAEQKLSLADQQLSIQESKSKTRTLSIFIVSLLLGSILLWFSFRQRQKRMQQQLVAIEREQEVRTLETLMEGEEKERLRIAKELHDGVNGDLAAIKFKLTSLLETNNQVINEAVEMIDTSSEQVRAISHNLVPPSLRDFNLLEAVATYCENMNGIHRPEITFQHLGNAILLDKKQEANLFRIVQELVSNSIKHAEAKEIHIQLSNVEDNLQLTVEDDGKGFDAENVASDGIGIQNVKSRVDYLGGLMDVKSDDKGTSFTITITDKPKKA